MPEPHILFCCPSTVPRASSAPSTALARRRLALVKRHYEKRAW